jgi:hypothetical protein
MGTAIDQALTQLMKTLLAISIRLAARIPLFFIISSFCTLTTAAADLTLGTVNESDLLAKVEAGGLGVVDTLNLHQGGVGVGGVLGALVAQVASPVKKSVLIL